MASFLKKLGYLSNKKVIIQPSDGLTKYKTKEHIIAQTYKRVVINTMSMHADTGVGLS